MNSIITLLSAAVISSLFLVGSVSAQTCLNLTIPITVTESIIVDFSIPTPVDQYDVNEFTANITSRSADLSVFTKGTTNITDTFDISVRYCKPESSINTWKNRTGVVQILTHGIGFEKSYWDFPLFNSHYSWTNHMLNHGFSTLSWDRLGCGASSKPAPNIPQVSLEAAILVELTKLLRTGNIASNIPPARKVILVGHSYGSALSNTAVVIAPEVSDGIVLTGWSHDNTWLPQTVTAWVMQPAAWNQPQRFGTHISPDCKNLMPSNLPLNYMTWGGLNNNQLSFFHLGGFDKLVLNYAEATKQPYAVSQALTLSGFSTTDFVASDFKGPVQMLIGQNDMIYCNGNCTDILEQGATKFPSTSAFEIYLQPNTGHALNLHYNSTGAFDVVCQFLGRHGF